MLLGADAIERLQNSHVAVFRLRRAAGGEALARSGIGN